ncbi:MAG: oligosaccharide flippase family protein [Chloroflexi bacterium]|nr:oligosaccharide flippase family protein [Chloroflexota bacterium]
MRQGLLHRFAQGFAWNYAGRIAEFGLRFLFISFVARRVGPDSFGVYSFAVSTFTAVTLMGAFGYEQALNTFVPRHAGHPKRLAYLLRQILVRRILIFAALSLLLVLITPWIERAVGPAAGGLLWILPYLFFFNLANLLAYFLIGLLDVTLVSVVRVGIQAANLGLSVLVLNAGGDIRAVLFIMGVTAMVAALIYLAYLRGLLRAPAEPFPLGDVHRFGATLGVTNGLNYVLGQQADVMLLGFLLHDSAAIGYYNLAALLNLIFSSGLLIGFEGIAQSALSEVADRGLDRLAQTWEALIKVAILLAVPALSFAALHAAEIVGLYGAGFTEAARLLQVYLAFTVVARFFGGGTNTSTLYAMKRERIPLITRTVSGALNVGLALLWIPLYGPLGAVLATGLSGLATTVPETIITLRVTQARYPIRFAAKVLLASAGALVLTRPLAHPGLIPLVAGALAFILLFAIILALLKPLSVEDQALFQRLNPRLGHWLERLT